MSVRLESTRGPAPAQPGGLSTSSEQASSQNDSPQKRERFGMGLPSG
jgi:hypothetical protein